MKLYQHRNWLDQKYWGRKLSCQKIADLCGVQKACIRRWLVKFDIPRRTSSEAHKKQISWNKGLTSRNDDRILAGEKSGLWKGGQVKRICEYCGNEFYIYPCKIKKNEGIVCNRICQNKLYSKKYQGKGNPNWGKHHSEKTKKKIGNASKRKTFSIETRRKNRVATKELWQNPEYVKKVLKATNRRPTNPEIAFDKMTADIIRYTGNGSWWRKLDDGKHHNPDFKITGQNKVIEVFGDYWHRGEDPQELIELYALVGLDCLIFWEHEIYNQPEIVLDQVNQFISC